MKSIIDGMATIFILLIITINVSMLVVIAKQHDERPAPYKTVTITGFQEPLMQGYSFLETRDKLRLSGIDKMEMRQDLGVKATITTYRENETPTVETADVWMWRIVQ